MQLNSHFKDNVTSWADCRASRREILFQSRRMFSRHEGRRYDRMVYLGWAGPGRAGSLHVFGGFAQVISLPEVRRTRGRRRAFVGEAMWNVRGSP